MGEARRMGLQRRCCSTGVGACWGSPALFLRANAARTASVCGWPLAARNKKTPASRSCRGFPLHHGRGREARARSFCANFPQTVVASMHLRSILRIILRKVLTTPALPYLSTAPAPQMQRNCIDRQMVEQTHWVCFRFLLRRAAANGRSASDFG